VATVRTRVEPIDRDVNLIIDELLSPAARSREFAETARSFLADADETNRRVLGRIPPSHTFVDGREGAALESVHPDGVIVREYDLIAEALIWISDELKRKSPKLSGRYGNSHTLFADGVEVDIGGVIPAAEKYVFLNTTAYARKIEGASGRPPSSRQAPAGVYQVTARQASAKFGNSAKITFAYDAPLGGGIFDWAHTASARRLAHRVRGGNQARHTAWLTKVPSILVRLPR
jgi:hypothetical protein